MKHKNWCTAADPRYYQNLLKCKKKTWREIDLENEILRLRFFRSSSAMVAFCDLWPRVFQRSKQAFCAACVERANPLLCGRHFGQTERSTCVSPSLPCSMKYRFRWHTRWRVS